MGFLGMALLALLGLFLWLLFFFIVLGLFFVIGRSGGSGTSVVPASGSKVLCIKALQQSNIANRGSHSSHNCAIVPACCDITGPLSL